MIISEIKKQARQSLKGQWGTAVQLTLLMFLVTMVVPIVIDIFLNGGFANWADPYNEPTIFSSVVGFIISFALIPFSTAVSWFFLSLSRLDRPEITEVFTIYKDGKTSLKIIGASILIALFVILWSLLLIIPGIIKAISYSQTYFIMKDHPEFSMLEAITESKNRMKGYKWKYFLLNLSFIGWGILCLFTLGIGLLWLIPYISTSNAAFFNEISASKE